MQNTSSTYNAIWGESNKSIEVKINIDGVDYFQDEIFSLKISRQMYKGSTASVGGCCASTCEFTMIRTSATIPVRATVIPYVRLKSENGTTSEWIPKGYYFVDTRSYTNYSSVQSGVVDTMTFVCYDRMLTLDRTLSSVFPTFEFPCYMYDYVNQASTLVGGAASLLSQITAFNNYFANYSVFGFLPPYIKSEDGHTIREIFSDIAAICGGNLIFDEYGNLQFIPLNCQQSTETGYLVDESANRLVFGDTRILLGAGTNDVTAKMKDYSDSPAYTPFNSVILNPKTRTNVSKVDRILEVETSALTIESGVVAIVESYVLNYAPNHIKNFSYQPYKATGTVLNPVMQLGDTITLNGITSIIASIDTDYSALSTATIEAPYDEELNYEYQFRTETERQIDNKVTLGQSYGGATINSDGFTAKGDSFSLFNNNGERVVYFDADSQTYKFVGNVEIADGSITFSKLSSDVQDKTNYAEELANGTASGGSFISGSAIYSPTIFANQFNVFPNNQQDSSGAFNVYGTFNNVSTNVFSVEYYSFGDYPIVNIGSPDNADIYLGRAVKNGATIENRVYLGGHELYISNGYVRAR